MHTVANPLGNSVKDVDPTKAGGALNIKIIQKVAVQFRNEYTKCILYI